MNQFIFMKNVRFHACHGVMPQEQAIGADFLISVRIGYDFSKAINTDDVSDTISYADVYKLIKQEMQVPSKLLEHVAGRIVNAIKKAFPDISSLELSLTKENPPMGADSDGAGVEIHWSSLNNDKTQL